MGAKTVWDVYAHHRGPYQLSITRPRLNPGKKQAPFISEHLPGTFSKQEILEEVPEIFKDRRDNVDTVFVWSVREKKHIMTYKRPR